MRRQPNVMAFLLGAGAGALVGGLVWSYASRRLDRRLQAGSAELSGMLGVGQEQLRRELEAGRAQLRSQVTAQVQAMVPDVIDERLALYGITPRLVRNVEQVLDYGERVGLIG